MTIDEYASPMIDAFMKKPYIYISITARPPAIGYPGCYV
jgi:hypothetical protein